MKVEPLDLEPKPRFRDGEVAWQIGPGEFAHRRQLVRVLETKVYPRKTEVRPHTIFGEEGRIDYRVEAAERWRDALGNLQPDGWWWLREAWLEPSSAVDRLGSLVSADEEEPCR